MCGKKSGWLLVCLLGFLWVFLGSSSAQNVVVPQETWNRILTTVDELEKTLGELKNERQTLIDGYEMLLTNKDEQLRKEKIWSQILNDSLNKVKSKNEILKGAVIGLSIAIPLLIGAGIWLY